MIGRAAHEAVVKLGPSLQRAAAIDKFGIARGKLPAPADATTGVRAREGHRLDVFGVELESRKARPSIAPSCGTPDAR